MAFRRKKEDCFSTETLEKEMKRWVRKNGSTVEAICWMIQECWNYAPINRAIFTELSSDL